MTEAGRFTFGHARAEAGDFIRRVYAKAEQDQIFFMAGAIAFNVLVAIVPLVLAAIGIAGLVLRNIYFGDTSYPVQQYLIGALPNVSTDFIQKVTGMLEGIIDRSTNFTIFGTILFVWFATRLVGTLRTALREVFDIQNERPIIIGKLFDIKMVVVAGSLLVLNVGLTLLIAFISGRSFPTIGSWSVNLGFLQTAYLNSAAFLFIWLMFLLVYRFLPVRRIQWRTALISATFTAIVFELMKYAFALYAARANYKQVYDSFWVIAVLVIWVYYASIAFILGGEVGQVWTLRRTRRRQKERLG